ncbi:MAG TPA: uroporphyrinogen-III synthase [Chitinophaga sp.]|uniref:uroporphyrinogen-III synthase n=1 Tax=Chitinophaga sp. TaxID=1869181 RepID=UPI002BC86134|nr:uroporphyrinogen-III synthase [Chitinophaga sp.]HVI47075.1 uroporphyrinogen-III synthase [Chitinophaga sp.]
MPDDKYRILCTRPLTDSLLAEAGDSGIRIDIQEFIQIKSLPCKDLTGTENLIQVFGGNKICVFTSANAVNILVACYLNQDNHIFPVSNPVGCIAGNTAEQVRTQLPSCKIIAEATYGKDLATAIIQLGNIPEVNFFCGNQRRDELPETLRGAGIIVNEYVIYGNVSTPVAITADYDGIMFFSPSAVKSFFSANSISSKTICFAIGTTTAASLKEHTNNKIIISPGTSQESMVETAIFYFNNIN